MAENQTNKERLDSINTKLDNIISSLENKAGVTQPTTLKNLLDTTKKAAYLFYDYSGASVDDLITYDDTSNVTSMYYMFKNCSNLTTIPLLDTGKVTSMSSMFDDCRSLTTIPLLDTGNVTAMGSMFSACSNLTTIPLLNTSNVTDMFYMFNGCNTLTIIPLLNTSKVTSMYEMFRLCPNLSEIHMYGMKVNFDISPSTKFTQEALVEILNNLATVTSSRTLTMGSTNLAKLTDEDKAIATAKGWTLA